MPVEEPGHHGERGALEPLGPARNWLQQRLGASLPGPGSRYWLLSRAKPLLVFGVLKCTYTEPGNYSQPTQFKARQICQLKTMCE